MTIKSQSKNDHPNVLRSVKAIIEAERVERRKPIKKMIAGNEIVQRPSSIERKLRP